MLIKYTGKYVNIYFNMKITYLCSTVHILYILAPSLIIFFFFTIFKLFCLFFAFLCFENGAGLSGLPVNRVPDNRNLHVLWIPKAVPQCFFVNNLNLRMDFHATNIGLSFGCILN